MSSKAAPIGKGKSPAPYICALCNCGFTRKSTVKDPHFSSCVRRRGNPKNVAWDDHPSCFSKLPDGSFGPSGEIPAGLLAALKRKEDAVVNLTDHTDVEDSNTDIDETTSDKLGESQEEWEDADASSMVKPKEARKRGRTSISPKLSESPVEGKKKVHTWRGYCPDWIPQNKKLEPTSFPFPLSSLLLNQFADILIGAGGKLADKGHQECIEVWKLWHDLLPEDKATKIKAPEPSFSAIQRRQAVIWLAQEVYAADLDLMESAGDQLELILRGRDILVFFNDKGALSRVDKLLFPT